MRSLILLNILMVVISFAAFSQTPVFVKHDATGNNNGTSWADAYTSLQTALTAASSGQDIWVAAGTYTPSQEVGGTGNRFRTFQLKNGVGLYGGFAGNEDPSTYDLNDRDFVTNETILSGDLGGENIYHVFRHVNIGLNSTAILDGFTISAGLADGPGDDNRGGGMLNSGSSSANGSSPTIRNSVFKDNVATEGGAMYNSRYSSPIVTGTTFSTNTASGKGGAVFNIRNAPVFSNCNFEENNVSSTGSNDGGGAIYNTTSTATEGPTISHCSFSENTVSSTSRGGAIFSYLNPGKISISNSSFKNNAAQYGGALFHNSGSDINRDASDVQIDNSTFEENTAMYGGAIFSDRHNSMITSCIIRGNEATEQSGGFYGRNAFSKLINSLISGNKSGKHGGGVYYNAESPEIINTTITGNYSGERGGGISMVGASTFSFNNSILYGNASPQGNELWVCETCTANIDHSLYGNAAGDVYTATGGVVNATNSLNSDPVFLNPYDPPTNTNTPNILGNYFICGCTSPCIDAGLNSHVPSGITQDLRGTVRILDGNGDGNAIADLGAYEFDPNGCNALAPFAGDGSAGSPYEISMLQQLYWIAVESSRWDKHYIQTADIDACNTETWFSGAGWIPIGNATLHFSGSYDGQGHSIANLHINRPASSNQGLFGLIKGISTQKVLIQNLILIDVSINGYREVGALFGLADQWVDVFNCHVSGTISGNRNTGGLAGWGRRTDFLQCSSSANVEMNNISNALYHGGLIGHINTSSTVKQSFAIGNVSGRGRVGGLLGVAGWNSQVENCFARGNVESDISNPMIGGLIGEVWNAGVRNSYSTGIVDMNGITSDYGGLVGNKTTSSNYFDENNFWDIQTSGLTASEMGTGKTTTEMQTQSTFTNWDFSNIWAIENGINDSYPHLRFSLFTWTGSQSTVWDDEQNWSPQAIPPAGYSIHIPGALSNYPVLDQSRILLNLNIATGGSLTIPLQTGLTVNGTLTNNASTSGLLIQSSPSGTGSLLHNTDDVPATIERYIPATSFHLISVPITQTSNPISGWLIWSYLYEFDIPTQQWSNMGASTSTSLNVNQGYMIYKYPGPSKWQSDTTYAFEGMLNNGTFYADVSYPDVPGNHNLVPNPYPSAIDWNAAAGWTRTHLAGSYWMWIHSANNYGVWNGSAGTHGVTKDIPVGQAFFVHATAVNPVLAMNNNVRLHSPQTFHKEKEELPNLLRLNASFNDYSDEMVVLFDDNAGPDYDHQEDASKLYGGNLAPQIYSMSADDHKLTINMLPLTNEKIKIPVGFELSIEGEACFVVSSISTFNPEVTIHLCDRLTGTMTDLRKSPEYTFYHHPDNPAERFDLLFNSAVGVDELLTPEASVYFSNGWLHLNISEEFTGMTTVNLFNVSGQLVFSCQAQPGRSAVSATGLSSGAYMVQLFNEKFVVSRKAINN